MMASASRKTFRDTGMRDPTSASTPTREGDVGRRRDGPAFKGHRIVGVDGDVNQGRDDHAAQCGDGGQSGLLEARQLAFDQLALDLQADEEEEHDHQAVVDPVKQALVEADIANAQRDVRMQQSVVGAGERRIGEQQRHDGGSEQNDASCGLVLDELQGALEFSGHLLLIPVAGCLLAGPFCGNRRGGVNSCLARDFSHGERDPRLATLSALASCNSLMPRLAAIIRPAPATARAALSQRILASQRDAP